MFFFGVTVFFFLDGVFLDDGVDEALLLGGGQEGQTRVVDGGVFVGDDTFV